MKKILLISVIFGITIAVILGVFLQINSSGVTPSHLSGDGKPLSNSIAEIRDVSINGVTQRLLIRGVNKDNPLLLHLHGGPGGPDQTLLQSFGKTLEDVFTVVYWDQRGSGASYYSDMADKPLTLQMLVEDGVTISEMLLNEFEKEQLYLHGHSWGTLLGINLITERADLFKAFFAVGLFGHSQRAEKLSWDFTINAAREVGDESTVERLISMGSPPYRSNQQWVKNVTEQRKLLWPYENPDAKPLFTMLDVYWRFALYDGYTVSEKLRAFKGLDYTMDELWPTVVATNLINTHTKLDVPIYVFQGKYDQHTVTEVAKDYFDVINAPDKAYHVFENSAHWPHINEYQAYRERIFLHLQTLEAG